MMDKKLRFPTETFLQLLNNFQPSTIRYPRRVFVNRNLRMSKIDAVGFDMDYTLAVYGLELDFLVWEMALERLVERHDFPEKVLQFEYDPLFAIRGLVLDTRRGNIFKMDKHRHVSRVTHGTRPLDHEARNDLYRRRPMRLANPSYALVDTLFSLPETNMYAQMVDLLDAEGKGEPESYAWAYKCIRTAVDAIHRDGTLKEVVVRDLGKYVIPDRDIAHTLERFIYSGKKLFLATNSDWRYTDALMSFLLDGVLDSFSRWTDYFDLIVVSASKPGFFGKGQTMDHEPDAPGEVRFKSYRGGNIRAAESLLSASGDKILYIGDHIYGDILKSKKSSNWRTAMIVPEMEGELENLDAVREDRWKLDRLFARRHIKDIELNYQQRLLMSMLNLDELARDNEAESASPFTDIVKACDENVGQIRDSLDRLEMRMEANQEAILSRFNVPWGMLFKEGSEHSVFGAQVEDYACIYTSRLSNFLSYSPLQYFRSARDLLAHERQS